MTKQAFITGGTKGIGKAVATSLAKVGYDLILTYASDEQVAKKTADKLRKDYSVKIDILQADITERRSIDLVEQFLKDSDIRLDAIVLNAGTTYRETFEQMNLVEWERQFFANVHFPVFVLQRILGRINRGAAIVFTGSLMGVEAHAMSLSYGVTKSTIHALTKNLVKFLSPYGIRVNAVAPGFVDTEWQKNKPAEIRRNIEQKIALGRFCEPEEVADIYKMLIENSYMNGSVVVVDGAYSYR